MDELESLRQEMSALKQNLDRQQIINKKMLRNVMRQRASWLNTFVNAEIIIIPLAFFMFAGICISAGISIWYAIIMLILSIIDTAFDWRTMRISPRLLSTASMLELRKKLIRQKKERFWQTCISAPTVIIWVVLFIRAMFAGTNIWDDKLLNLAGATSGIIGGVAGIIIAIIIYRKAQGTNDSMLGDIEDADTE